MAGGADPNHAQSIRLAWNSAVRCREMRIPVLNAVASRFQSPEPVLAVAGMEFVAAGMLSMLRYCNGRPELD